MPVDQIITLTAKIAASYLEANRIPPDDLPGLVQTIHGALNGISNPPAPQAEKPIPAVPVKKSVTPDYIVCLEDGKKLKMLKRYLRTAYGMTPEEYRAKWGLPGDYPMVAPNYSERRSSFARDIGLGRRPNKSEQAPEVEEPTPDATPKKARRGRPKAA
ncbi:MucR family transcriptional regulator [Indioceanicola profundi]|uniref:MucR family transcriptional regulator n=1 Tax=Indioceanicola profundi TaxID=2220096 RepID=UPI000E6AE135|nr:MucR family transcriptional regulator [Indioceanicola profundi]